MEGERKREREGGEGMREGGEVQEGEGVQV